MSKRILYPLGAIVAGVILPASLSGLNAQQSAGEGVSIGRTTSAASLRARRGRKRAFGSSPKRPTCRLNS